MNAKDIVERVLWQVRQEKEGVLRMANAGEVIWNVADTSKEKPPECDNNSWTAFWQRMTHDDVPSMCPVCGERLTASNTDGAHVRFRSEPEDNMAWVVPLCSTCNNWQNVSRKVIADKVYFARTAMSAAHKNAVSR